MVRLALLAALVPACVTADDAVDTSETVSAENVTEQPKPSVICEGCSENHILGEPIRIHTSYHGQCHDFSDYECAYQAYSPSFECAWASCVIGPTEFSDLEMITPITPTSPGALLITVGIHSQHGNDSFLIPTVFSFVPDRIGVACTAGAHRLPCRDGANGAPVMLSFSLYSGDTKLQQGHDFVAAGAGGSAWGGAGWTTSTPGLSLVDIRYEDLATTYSVVVAHGPGPRVVDVHADVTNGVEATRE